MVHEKFEDCRMRLKVNSRQRNSMDEVSFQEWKRAWLPLRPCEKVPRGRFHYLLLEENSIVDIPFEERGHYQYCPTLDMLVYCHRQSITEAGVLITPGYGLSWSFDRMLRMYRRTSGGGELSQPPPHLPLTCTVPTPGSHSGRDVKKDCSNGQRAGGDSVKSDYPWSDDGSGSDSKSGRSEDSGSDNDSDVGWPPLAPPTGKTPQSQCTSDSRNAKNGWGSKAFVKMSATCSVVDIHSREMSPAATLSLTK